MILWLLGLGLAVAAPLRGPRVKAPELVLEEGRDPALLVVKLAEGQGLRVAGGVVVGGQGTGLTELNALLEGSRAVFSRDPAAIRADRARVDPDGRLADLTLYRELPSTGDQAGLHRRGEALLAHPLVEGCWYAFLPAPPPADIDPETPDFTDLQGYLGSAPVGLGFAEALDWPGGDGSNVTIIDIEYGWEPEHEDLEAVPAEAAVWGWNSDYYRYHGNSVLGQLVGGINGYGIDGMVPGAEALVASPYRDVAEYSVADAVDGAAALLDPGDLILIEQQLVMGADYGPVEWDPATFDAITLAVAKGIVVVEPGGNGGQDLDHRDWEGWFDREIQDSGAIMVGGGASPTGGLPPRTWYLNGSSFGSRVDVQAWYDHIVTATTGEYGSSLADLFYPGGDTRQAYTERFGGTSGASPMVTAVAAIANSVSWELRGEPWDPVVLRQALVNTGTPQPASDLDHPIGPQPDLHRLLRTYLPR